MTAFRFRSQIPLNGDALVHTTDRKSARKILESRQFTGTRAGRMHDGFARRSDCPELTFFSTEEIVYPVSPHPVYAEPGELCSSLALSMDKFTRHLGEYKLFVVTCVPSSGHVFENAQLRVTLMLCREEHWAWCRDHNLLELDIFSNKLFAVVESETGGLSWQKATHYFSAQHGWRDVQLIVSVASDKAKYDDCYFTDDEICCIDTMHVFQVSPDNS